jgi:AraC-like DNA-binding protein
MPATSIARVADVEEFRAAIMPADSARQRRRQDIMNRFRALAEGWGDRPPFLPEVCAALGVNVRTFNQICHEQLGVGLKRYLLLRRLHLAHQALSDAPPGGTTVTEIATQYGFWELGRFAGLYGAVYGQHPSATLRCASGLAAVGGRGRFTYRCSPPNRVAVALRAGGR